VLYVKDGENSKIHKKIETIIETIIEKMHVMNVAEFALKKKVFLNIPI